MRWASATSAPSGIGLAGLLHDVGKIGISDRVLTKPGPLDRRGVGPDAHPPADRRPAAVTARAERPAPWILAHHERPDGSGYPFGLSGDEIPAGGAHPRRGGRLRGDDGRPRLPRGRWASTPRARSCSRGAGTQFDAEVVDALLAALDREAPALSPAALSPRRAPRPRAARRDRRPGPCRRLCHRPDGHPRQRTAHAHAAGACVRDLGECEAGPREHVHRLRHRVANGADLLGGRRPGA